MQNNIDVYDGLSILFKRDSVPNNLTMYGSKEQTLAKFRTTCRESDYHMKQAKPPSHGPTHTRGPSR